MAERTFPAMGSNAHVIVVGNDALLDHAQVRIEQLESRWSRFRPGSEVSILNAHRGRPVMVTADTYALVAAAVAAWRDTAGRFDPTVLGDLTREGYDRPFQAVAVRPGRGVSLLTRNCGGIELDPVRSAITMPADAGFDPGGIGKGLAADIVVEELIRAGAAGACVNIGGDLRVEGRSPDGGPWVNAIDHPLSTSAAATIALEAGAVATSMTTGRAWTVGGRRRHHLIDPATGQSRASRLIAATAVARTAARAEVATKAALMADAGHELDAFDALGCDGFVIDHDGDVFRSAGMSAFESMVAA